MSYYNNIKIAKCKTEKNYMQKILSFGFGLLIIVSINNPALAEQKCIKFCTLPFAPFVITDKNNQVSGGFDIELAKALCKEMGANCKFILRQKRTQLLTDLNSGKCDAWIAAFTISPGRKKYMDFTQAYHAGSASLIATKNSTFSSKNIDLKNKKIAVTAGSNFVTYLQINNGYDIKKTEYSNVYRALAALKTNKVDAVISDSTILKHWINQKSNRDFRLIDLPPYNKEFSIGRGYGIPVKKGNIELLNALNQALEKIKASGEYNEIEKKYFTNT